MSTAASKPQEAMLGANVFVAKPSELKNESKSSWAALTRIGSLRYRDVEGGLMRGDTNDRYLIVVVMPIWLCVALDLRTNNVIGRTLFVATIWAETQAVW